MNDNTTAVNVKVKFIRPEYNNLKEWVSDKNNVYIGRRGIVFVDGKRFPEKDSIWANPFKISKTVNRDNVIEQYEEYIRNKLNNDNKLVELLLKLEGKRLGCWCHPESCHGDILIKLIKEFKQN